jgi:hypothetical protein
MAGVTVPTQDELDTLATRVSALEADNNALTARVVILEGKKPPPPPPPPGPSPDGTRITNTTDKLTDSAGNVFQLFASAAAATGNQIMINGVLDPVTQQVTALEAHNGVCFQQARTPAQWWDYIAKAWIPTTDPNVKPPQPGSLYRVQNGQIYDPSGKPFRAKGVNVCYRRLWGDNQVDLTRVSLAALKRAYPTGLNFVRWACHWENPLPPSSDPVAAQWVSDLTGAGIIVLVDLHVTGNAIDQNDQRANGWLADWATWGKNNPRVWFDTQNEPQGSGAAVSAMMQGQYNAVRNAGNGSPILLSTGMFGDGLDGMNPAYFNAMKNVSWDSHCYGWMTDRWPEQMNALAKYKSQDGNIPTICGEFGDGGGSNQRDGNWVQNVQTALANPGGFGAWMINWAMDNADCLWADPLDGSVIQADYGKMVHDAIVAA